MAKVILNRDKNLHPNKYKKGDVVDLPDRIVERLVNNGVAHYPIPPEILSMRRNRKSLKLNIVCEGLMFGHSGFAEAMRNITYSLYCKGCNVTTSPHDAPNADILKTKKGKIISSLKHTAYNNNYRTANIVMTSPLGVINKDGNYRIGYVMFETQEIPKVFIDSLMHNTDELWCPSTFNLKNFTKAGYSKPIFAMPLGVDVNKFDPDTVEPLNIGVKGKFVFLSIMGWSERKGISILAEAYLREFSGKDNTILYLKGGWYRPEQALKDIAKIATQINKQGSPKIITDFKLYSDAQLPRLYKSADSFVLPSLGEGWGLDYTEAMSMGLPTIGTRATSQLDFMTVENSFLIDVAEYRPEPKCNWICPQYIGGDFAIPSMEHLQKLMRQVYSNPALGKQKGEQARKDMVKKWQWKHAANKWFKRLKELEVIL